MPATTVATTSSAPTMYLFAANHDCEGCKPALSTSSGDEVLVSFGSALAAAPAGVVSIGVAWAGAGLAIAGAEAGFIATLGPAKLLNSFGLIAV